MSTSQGYTGYTRPTQPAIKLLENKCCRITAILVGSVIIFGIIAMGITVCILHSEYPTPQGFKQVESATVTSRLNATASEWDITLLATNPGRVTYSIKVVEVLAVYRNYSLTLTPPAPFVLNKGSQTRLDVKLVTGDDSVKELEVAKAIDYDRTRGYMSYRLEVTTCWRPHGLMKILSSKFWGGFCFYFAKCDPVDLRFSDNGTATLMEQAQCI